MYVSKTVLKPNNQSTKENICFLAYFTLVATEGQLCKPGTSRHVLPGNVQPKPRGACMPLADNIARVGLLSHDCFTHDRGRWMGLHVRFNAAHAFSAANASWLTSTHFLRVSPARPLRCAS